MGRVVITHSTYLEGLIPLLKRLAKDPQVVTVTPAVISRVKGRFEPFNGDILLTSCIKSLSQQWH